MKFIVLASNDNWETLQSYSTEINWARVETIDAFFEAKDADAYFNLLDNSSQFDYSSLTNTVFINSVNHTLAAIHAANNIIRINAWHGFIEKEIWEIAGEVTSNVEAIIRAINKKIITVDDEPGFVSARVIAMIINEAYFTKGENVSSEADIDIAMKLGTNYPYGPFEWCNIIGISNVYTLLKKLSETDDRYLPAPLLSKTYNEKI
jgi:3-hydroxybutyryl-CoA dehydrogenase